MFIAVWHLPICDTYHGMLQGLIFGCFSACYCVGMASLTSLSCDQCIPRLHRDLIQGNFLKRSKCYCTCHTEKLHFVSQNGHDENS